MVSCVQIVLYAMLLIGSLSAQKVGAQDTSAQDTSAQECASDIVDFQGALGRSTIKNGREVFELTKPILLQCETELIARIGVREAINQYRFEGDVRIVARGDTVFADNVLYFSESKIGQATGNVLITDGWVQLTAPEAIYFTDEKRTVFNSGVHFQDSTTVLTSLLGTYWSENARAEFNTDVELRQDSLLVYADSLTYWRDLEEMAARGNVYIEQSDGEHIAVFGKKLFHSALTDSTHIQGEVDMLQTSTDSTGTDSLFVRSHHIYMTTTDSTEHVLATDDVQLIQGDFSAVGDTLVYVRSTDDRSAITQATGSPLAWLDGTQIRSDDLRLTRTDGMLDSLWANGDVFVSEYDSVLARVQQLKGRSLVGQFEQDTLRTMTMAPNAEALYYVESTEDGGLAATRVTSDSIVFTFQDGELVKIGSYDDLDGEYFPSEIVDQAGNLDGFQWNPDQRPELQAFRDAWATKLTSTNRQIRQ